MQSSSFREHLLMASAVLSTQKHQHFQSPNAERQLQECKWFEKNGYNAVVERLKAWPTRFLVDLLHYSCQVRPNLHTPSLRLTVIQIQYPSKVSVLAQQGKLIHQINAKYIQAILYTVQAREISLFCTAADLPKTAFPSKSPPSSPVEIKAILYKNVFQRYTELQQLVQALGGNTAADQTFAELLQKMTQKLIVLAPLAFEAMLFMNCLGTTSLPDQGPVMADEMSLSQIIDHTIALDPPQKPYSAFADMVLSAFSQISRTTDQEKIPQPVLSPTSTVNLLGKIVEGLRRQPKYDATQGARWIRCMLQVVLDQRDNQQVKTQNLQSSSTDSEAAVHINHNSTNFGYLIKLTDHGLLLARSNSTFPAEEIQWLATTLFNLAVDMYMAASSTAPSASNLDPRTTTKAEMGVGRPDGGPKVTGPQQWAKRAVEFADVLARNTSDMGGASGAGGKDTLANDLRARCKRFNWDV